MNVADFFMMITILGCPLAAGITAASQKIGWFTALFMAAGLLIGIAAGLGINKLAYLLLHSDDRQKPMIGLSLALAYLILPVVLASAVIAATAWLTALAAKGLF